MRKRKAVYLIFIIILLSVFSSSNLGLEPPQSPPSDYESITEPKTGWNLISPPVEINKTSLYVWYNDTVYTFDDAVSGGLIVSTVFGWDRVNQVYLIAETLYPGEGYWMYAYYNCTLMKECEMATFGITTLQDSASGIDPYRFGDNNYWGTAQGGLCYCPHNGNLDSVSAYLSIGTGTIHVARAGLLRATNPPPEAPYITRHGGYFLNGTLVAYGELKHVTATAAVGEWVTWDLSHEELTPGYYIPVVYTYGVYVWGNIIETSDMTALDEYNTLVTNDDERIRPLEFEWPTDLGQGYGCLQASGTSPIDYSIQPLIYCTYQPTTAWMGLTGTMTFPG